MATKKNFSDVKYTETITNKQALESDHTGLEAKVQQGMRSDIIKKRSELLADEGSLEDVGEEDDILSESSETEDPLFQQEVEAKIIRPVTAEKLAKFQKQQDHAGIVYLSRIPPFMKPLKIQHLLGRFGNIGRVYLAPEDPKIRQRRKKYGGNKKKNYTEGWVEFCDKSIAKKVALLLNATPIGGNKRNYYHDDLWNIKYLPKFKWHHLTEQIAYENASRNQRLQAEISQARRENKDYIKKVERAKMIKSIEEKKSKRRQMEIELEGTGANEDIIEIRRKFKQRKLISSETNSYSGNEHGSIVTKNSSENMNNAREKTIDLSVKKVLPRVFGSTSLQ